jgi:AcrR family transcriptional regulator
VDLREAAIAEPLRIERRQHAPHRPARLRIEMTTNRHTDRTGLRMPDHERRLADPLHRRDQFVTGKRRPIGRAVPVTERGSCESCGHPRLPRPKCHRVARVLGPAYNPSRVAAPSTPREQKKAETRARILRCAHEMFRTRGFESTTLEDICAAVPCSKRTYFRYFADKEALLVPNREKRLDRFVELLREAPVTESPFAILRQVTDLFAVEYTENREQLLAQQSLLGSSATLIAREREIDRDWEAVIVKVFKARLPPGAESERTAETVAGAVIGAVRATMRYWFRRGCVDDLAVLGHETIDQLEFGFGGRRDQTQVVRAKAEKKQTKTKR